jgi:FKBP-type peptidyl-prolyl cis-trans isomerase SlpA
MSEPVIGAGARVTLHFALTLDTGEVVDSTFERAPATFEVGDGKLLPGIERKLFGLAKGARTSFDIAPEDAFGQPNPANVQRFKRSSFAAGLELREGLVLSFADANRAELPGVISGFSGLDVLVDFNHPLAGRKLRFEVAIIDVTPGGAP